MHALTRLRDEEDGTTLMEALVAALVTAATLAIAFGVIWGFLRHTHGQIALSEVESDSRVVLREMLIHMREATSPGGPAGPVAEIAWDRVTVYADVAPSDGVADRVEYALINCDGTFCELEMTVTPPVDPAATVLSYDNDDSVSETVLSGVIATVGKPLFLGVNWDRDTSTLSNVSSCDPCSLGAIEIDLRVRPLESRVNPGTLRILEEVRLRNA